MSRKLKRRGHERYVALRYWLLQSPAWRSLPPTARALYIELARRYNGSNNGRISFSVREGADALHVGKDTAAHNLKILEERGFIVRIKRGAFSLKTSREASEWRLTEHDQDAPHPNHATKDFMGWQPPEPDTNERPKTRSFSSNRTVRLQGPNGPTTGTVKPENGPDGPSNRTVNAENPAATVRLEGHLQLPGTGGGPEAGERSAPEGSAVASEPPDWNTLGYPPGAPSREDHLAALERAALERGRPLSRRRAGGA
jgi:hypothetical protein